MMHDLSFHEYLALRVRLRGSPELRNSYFVNIQTDGYVTTDLWQHRLYFQRDDGEWEDVYVTISSAQNFLYSQYSPQSDFRSLSDHSSWPTKGKLFPTKLKCFESECGPLGYLSWVAIVVLKVLMNFGLITSRLSISIIRRRRAVSDVHFYGLLDADSFSSEWKTINNQLWKKGQLIIIMDGSLKYPWSLKHSMKSLSVHKLLLHMWGILVKIWIQCLYSFFWNSRHVTFFLPFLGDVFLFSVSSFLISSKIR